MAIPGANGTRATPQQLEQWNHTIETNGGIEPGDSRQEILNKLAKVNEARRRLYEFASGQGPIEYGNKPIDGNWGGHYEFDPESFKTTKAKWKDILKGLHEDKRKIDAICEVGPPSHDKGASEPQANAAKKFGHRMRNRNNDQIRYVQMYINRLEDAERQYEQQESGTVADFGKQNQDV